MFVLRAVPLRRPRGLAVYVTVATPCFRSLAISKNAPRRREEKSGSGARGLASQMLYVAGFPCPAGMLALPGGDAESFHRATSVRARSSGLITQPRHLRATEPVPSLPRSPGSRPAFPCRRCGKYRSGGSDVEKAGAIFCDQVRHPVSLWRNRSDFNNLDRNSLRRKISVLQSEGRFHPRGISPVRRARDAGEAGGAIGHRHTPVA